MEPWVSWNFLDNMQITYSGDKMRLYECAKLCPLDYCLEDLVCVILCCHNSFGKIQKPLACGYNWCQLIVITSSMYETLWGTLTWSVVKRIKLALVFSPFLLSGSLTSRYDILFLLNNCLEFYPCSSMVGYMENRKS